MQKMLTMLLLIAAAALFSANRGEVVLFQEGWETHPEDTNATPDNENWKTIIHPNGRPFNIWGYPHSGTRCVIHSTAGTTSGKPRDWLICKKPIAIPALGGFLSYFVAASKPQYYEVRVSTTSYADTNNFSNFLFNATTTSGSWDEKVFDLSAFAGKTIYIAWKRKGPYGQALGTGLFLDDIKMVGYTADQEGPACDFVYGNLALTGKSMHLSGKFSDRAGIDSVYAVTHTALQPMQQSASDTSIYSIEIPWSESQNPSQVYFVTKDKLGNRATSSNHPLTWGNKLLDENFNGTFPPAGWQNNGWKQAQAYGTYNTKAAYSSFMFNGEYLTTNPVVLTDDSKLSFVFVNRYFSVTGGGKVDGHDTLFCDVSTDNGSNWINLMDYAPAVADTVYNIMAIDLSPITGSTAMFRWRHPTDGVFAAEGALIDSVEIVGNFVSIPGETKIAKDSRIVSAYPNPFNNSTVVTYNLTQSADIRLAVYNAKGEFVKTLFNGLRSAGSHQATFNADGLNSGVYFYRLTTPTGISTRKVILCK